MTVPEQTTEADTRPRRREKGTAQLPHPRRLCPMTAERVRKLFVPVFQVADIYSFHSKESSVVDFPIVVIVEFQHN